MCRVVGAEDVATELYRTLPNSTDLIRPPPNSAENRRTASKTAKLRRHPPSLAKLCLASPSSLSRVRPSYACPHRAPPRLNELHLARPRVTDFHHHSSFFTSWVEVPRTSLIYTELRKVYSTFIEYLCIFLPYIGNLKITTTSISNKELCHGSPRGVAIVLPCTAYQ